MYSGPSVSSSCSPPSKGSRSALAIGQRYRRSAAVRVRKLAAVRLDAKERALEAAAVLEVDLKTRDRGQHRLPLDVRATGVLVDARQPLARHDDRQRAARTV